MPGKILIADDRFASRLMLSALFSGAYYDIVQADHAEGVVALAVDERPGAVIISDGMEAPGAPGLCEALRASDACDHVLRIVVTDRFDPVRTAMLIEAGADDVISRTCSDVEMLARVRRLFDHRNRISDLTLQGLGHLRPDGLAEAAGAFERPARIAIVSEAPQGESWAKALRGATSAISARVVSAADVPRAGLDVILLDADNLGPQTVLRLTAQARFTTESTPPEVLIAATDPKGAVMAHALDQGAGGVLRLPFHAQEASARITALHNRRDRLIRLRDTVQVSLKSAMTDPLTGLYNRRYALPEVSRLLDSRQPGAKGLALLMCDLDHFKWVNDTFGHAAGDAVLKNVARLMRGRTAGRGFAARIGGEEFLIALPDCTRQNASSFARDLRGAVGRLITRDPGAPEGLCVTMSIGIATDDGTSLISTGSTAADRLLARADRALYDAKSAGRNCVMSDFRRRPLRVGMTTSDDQRRGRLVG